MKTLFLIVLVIVLASGLIFSGCAKPTSAPAPTPAPAPAPTPAQTIKIGHLRTLTGHMALTGAEMIKAGQFAFEQAGYEVAGKKIEVITGDTDDSAAMAIDSARKMVEHDKVSMIIGPTDGAAQMAVSAYMNTVGIPLIFTNPGPLGVFFEKHQWTFLNGGTEMQISSVMGVAAYEKLGYRKVTVITGDWVPGHGFMDGFMAAFKSKGGQIIQEQYPPFDTNDFAPYLTQLKDADAVVAWFDGSTSIRFLTQYHDFGVRKRMPVVASFHGAFFAPYILAALPPAAAADVVGAYCPTPYTPLVDIDVNKRFVEAWKAKFGGQIPDDTHTGPYTGVLVALAALKATGGDTSPQKLREAILSLDFQAPEGRIHFDRETRTAIKTYYIGQVVKSGDQYTWTPAYTYPDVPPPFGFSTPPPPPVGK